MSDDTDPPDKFSDKFYKCHPTQKFAAVVCVICDNAYHVKDFVKLKNTKILSDNLVICPNHMLDLTSKKMRKT